MKSEHIASIVNLVLFVVILLNFHAIVNAMVVASDTVSFWYSEGYLHPFNVLRATQMYVVAPCANYCVSIVDALRMK